MSQAPDRPPEFFLCQVWFPGSKLAFEETQRVLEAGFVTHAFVGPSESSLWVSRDTGRVNSLDVVRCQWVVHATAIATLPGELQARHPDDRIFMQSVPFSGFDSEMNEDFASFLKRRETSQSLLDTPSSSMGHA